MSVLMVVSGALAGVVLIAVGSFSVVSLLCEDLLENDPPIDPINSGLSEAA